MGAVIAGQLARHGLTGTLVDASLELAALRRLICRMRRGEGDRAARSSAGIRNVSQPTSLAS